MEAFFNRPGVRRALRLAATLILPALLLAVRPLDMSVRQGGVLAALVLVITWWVTGVVERTAASLVLLAVFLLIGGAPARTVFSFPLSQNFLMIVFSFLFSQGISNSGLAARLLEPLLRRRAGTAGRLIAAMLLSAAVMIWVIPQPFSRIILLSLIFSGYYDRLDLSKTTRSALMLGLYYVSILLNMTMLRGDIILNGALVSMAGLSLSEGRWMLYMTLPTLGYLLLGVVLFRILFRDALKGFAPRAGAMESPAQPLSARDRRNLVFILLTVILWATEGLHGLSGTWVVIAATALMFPLGLLRLPDLRSVNVKLLVFLTAAFAIGGTLKACGVADKIFSLFVPLFPVRFSLPYVLTVLVSAVLLHTVLGSNITTMSVAVPGLMSIGAGVAPAEALLFFIYIGVCSQFLLPFHHVILLLGEGKGYYSAKELLRLGIGHTFLMVAAALLLYLPWWSVLGLA